MMMMMLSVLFVPYRTRFSFFNRAVSMAAIFRKSLLLSSSSRSEYNTGSIVTMMSVDAERVWQAGLLMNWLWMGPLLLIAAIAILFVEFGTPAAAALAVVVAIAIFQTYIANRIGLTRRRLVRYTDDRVKLTNEVLQGIRVLKVYNWEKPLQEKIERTRAEEVALLRQFHILKMLTLSVLFIAPSMVLYSLFTAYSSMGNHLTITKVFRGLAVVNMIRLPIALIPMAVSSATEGWVSLQRINKFMAMQEVQLLEWLDAKGSPVRAFSTTPSQTLSLETDSCTLLANPDLAKKEQIPETSSQEKTDAAGGGTVELVELLGSVRGATSLETDGNSSTNSAVWIDNASFAWLIDAEGHPNSFALQDINLNIIPGQLVAVVGAVGQGKSSLLSAIMGHMHRLQGQQRLRGNIAYVGQHPWIRNLSLRDNILFDSPYDHNRYRYALDAAQLTPDLDQLPNGDLTEIGERGINLSGGQKVHSSKTIIHGFVCLCCCLSSYIYIYMYVYIL
ncbi:MAG: ABC transporter transmembrane domain-containing protein, partial [Anaerolineales bacterium]